VCVCVCVCDSGEFRSLRDYYVIINYTESKQNQGTTRRTNDQISRDVTVNRGAHSTAQHDPNSNSVSLCVFLYLFIILCYM